MLLSLAFLGNYVTGRGQSTKVKVDRWLSWVLLSGKKILCKETRLAFLCSYVTWLCINTWNHTDMLSHICPTILVFAVKYFWSFIIEKEIYISLLLIDINCFDHVVSRWLCLDSVPKHFLHITIANYWLVNDMMSLPDRRV